jgi:regulator of sigma E protease
MLTAIVFIIILGLLIFVHELGHFLVARKNGITAYEFGFGFPPRIVGIQLIRGERLEKVGEEEKIKVEVSDYRTEDGSEVIKEVITDSVREVDVVKKVKKWRLIWGKRNTDEEWELEPGFKEDTIYSINWIPLGGFVKIKGEDGSHTNDPDSFSGKSAWVRVKVLFAGVAMNFVLAWVLISLALMIGAPEAVDGGINKFKDAKIQISQIIPGSPAEVMGIKAGDDVIKCQMPDERCNNNFSDVAGVQNFINDYKGKEIVLQVKRGKSLLDLEGTPRMEYPQGQGALGISLVQTAIVQYPWYEAIVKGFTTTVDIIVLIFSTLFGIVKGLIVGQKVAVDVSGPVGIAYLTKQVTELGLVYVMQFAALLSINLGIINGLPFPALDGGRILFILIEKIKGSPVSQKVENFVHTIGFVLLIALMILVTLKDILRFEIIQKIGNIF